MTSRPSPLGRFDSHGNHNIFPTLTSTPHFTSQFQGWASALQHWICPSLRMHCEPHSYPLGHLERRPWEDMPPTSTSPISPGIRYILAAPQPKLAYHIM